MFIALSQCAILRFSYADSRSMSQLKAIEFSLEFRVHSISLLPVKGFSLNFGQISISLRRCAEPMIQTCSLKVTIKGHGIKPHILCQVHVSFYAWKVFHYILDKYSSRCSSVHNPLIIYADTMSRSQLLVMAFSF